MNPIAQITNSAAILTELQKISGFLQRAEARALAEIKQIEDRAKRIASITKEDFEKAGSWTKAIATGDATKAVDTAKADIAKAASVVVQKSEAAVSHFADVAEAEVKKIL